MQDQIDHPERKIELSGAENVRDLGGYITADGKETRFGRFVRAGDMHSLTETDQVKLLEYGISTVVDLRMKWEVEAEPNVFSDATNVTFRIHDFWGNRFDDYRSADKTAAPHQKLSDLYCAGLRDSGFVMAEIMKLFAGENSSEGYIFHCRSGKDRTGLVAAMLLAIAGVPEETICADYALSSSYLQMPAINPIEASRPGAWQKLCEPKTMSITLAFLESEYGGVIEYLQRQGVSETQIEQIREQLLA